MNPIAWQTYEFEHKEKSNDWFWTAGILGVSAGVVSIIFGNILFAVLLIIGTASVILLGDKQPSLLECEINSKGVRVNKTLYPFVNIESFNVTDGPSAKILLKSVKFFMPLIVIPLGNINPEDALRTLSSKLILDETLQEPFAHVLSEHLGF